MLDLIIRLFSGLQHHEGRIAPEDVAQLYLRLNTILSGGIERTRPFIRVLADVQEGISTVGFRDSTGGDAEGLRISEVVQLFCQAPLLAPFGVQSATRLRLRQLAIDMMRQEEFVEEEAAAEEERLDEQRCAEEAEEEAVAWILHGAITTNPTTTIAAKALEEDAARASPSRPDTRTVRLRSALVEHRQVVETWQATPQMLLRMCVPLLEDQGIEELTLEVRSWETVYSGQERLWRLLEGKGAPARFQRWQVESGATLDPFRTFEAQGIVHLQEVAVRVRPALPDTLAAGACHSACVTVDGHISTWGKRGRGSAAGALGRTADGRDRWWYPCPIGGLQGAMGVSVGVSEMTACTMQGGLFEWGGSVPVYHGLRSRDIGPLEVRLSISGSMTQSMGTRYEQEAERDAHTEGPLYGSHLRSGNSVKWASASNGGSFIAALTQYGALYTWGEGLEGQLGHGAAPEVLKLRIPRRIDALSSLVIGQVSAGVAHTVCVTNGGMVYAWGDGSHGQIGVGDSVAHPTPVKVGGGARRGDREVRRSNQGWSDRAAWAEQRLEFDEEHAVQVCAGGVHTVCVTARGSLYRWGASPRPGGHGVVVSPWPVLVEGEVVGEHIIQAAAGFAHGIALNRRGQVFQWGWAHKGLLETHPDSLDDAYQVRGLASLGLVIKQVCAGWHHNLCISVEGEVYAWGSNKYGQLGFMPMPLRAFAEEPVHVKGRMFDPHRTGFELMPWKVATNAYVLDTSETAGQVEREARAKEERAKAYAQAKEDLAVRELLFNAKQHQKEAQELKLQQVAELAGTELPGLQPPLAATLQSQQESPQQSTTPLAASLGAAGHGLLMQALDLGSPAKPLPPDYTSEEGPARPLPPDYTPEEGVYPAVSGVKVSSIASGLPIYHQLDRHSTHMLTGKLMRVLGDDFDEDAQDGSESLASPNLSPEDKRAAVAEWLDAPDSDNEDEDLFEADQVAVTANYLEQHLAELEQPSTSRKEEELLKRTKQTLRKKPRAWGNLRDRMAAQLQKMSRRKDVQTHW